MNNTANTEKTAISTKLLIILFAAVTLACLCAILLIENIDTGGHTAVVSVDGVELYRIDLDTLTESRTFDAGGCTVLAEHGQIKITHSDCPDKLCVHQGAIKSSAGSIVCLPNKVIVYIIDGDDTNAPDAVIG